nr:hypothetical protein [Candidatus Sigynarchaeota archaeon]
MKHTFIFLALVLGISCIPAFGFYPPTSAAETGQTEKSGTEIAVGAIRWDAWYENPAPESTNWNISDLVEQTLAPEKYHHRVPFFANITSNGSVEMPVASQDLIDREINLAKNGGIDYWAYCWYRNGTGMELARLLHQSSAYRNEVNMCAILENVHFNTEQDIDGLIHAFTLDHYQRVMGDRPLVYFFSVENITATTIQRLRERCTEEGLPSPYVVLLSWNATMPDIITSVGADAASAYVTTGEDGAPFQQNMVKEQGRWEDWRRQGLKVIPIVTTGWDPRPRKETHVGWENLYADNSWIQAGTAQDIAQQLALSMLWVKDNPESAEARAVLIYAWNEFDEGGWIAPTRSDIQDNGTIVPERLDAIAQMRALFVRDPESFRPKSNPWLFIVPIALLGLGGVSLIARAKDVKRVKSKERVD